jgi:hypothetical protein
MVNVFLLAQPSLYDLASVVASVHTPTGGVSHRYPYTFAGHMAYVSVMPKDNIVARLNWVTHF